MMFFNYLPHNRVSQHPLHYFMDEPPSLLRETGDKPFRLVQPRILKCAAGHSPADFGINDTAQFAFHCRQAWVAPPITSSPLRHIF